MSLNRCRSMVRAGNVCTSGLALILLAGCAAGGGPVKVDTHEWTSPLKVSGWEMTTEHYTVRTTTRDTMLREYVPGFMEHTHAEYRKLLKPERPADKAMVVYLFGERPEWAAFTQGFVPSQAHTYLHIQSGGYMDQATATSVVFDIGRDRTLSLLAHEGLHQYLAKNFAGAVPPWLNEGLATQFEDFDLDGDRPTFRPERNLMRKNSLREALTVEDGLVPIPRLLAMNAGEAVTHTGQPARGYYAQVWITVLFLRSSPLYRDGFNRLLADTGTDRLRHAVSGYRAATPAATDMSDGEIAFRQYITDDLDGFAADCNAFARRLVY